MSSMPRHVAGLLVAACLLSAPAGAIDPPTTYGPAATPQAAPPLPAGGRAAAGADAGPAAHAPGDAGPQTQSRGTDGSTAGLTAPGATGASPQGMMSDATAGSQNPNLPVGGAPPASSGVSPRP